MPPTADTRFWKLCSRLVKVESTVLEAVEVESVVDDVLCDSEAANFCIRACTSLAALRLPPLAATGVVPLASPLDDVSWVTPPAFLCSE